MKQVIPPELLWGLQRTVRALWATPAVVVKSLPYSAELEAALLAGLHRKSGGTSSEKLMGFKSCGPQVLSSAKSACPFCSELGKLRQRT